MNKQRELQLNSLDALRHELARLLENGYTTRGSWDLAQTCKHIECWMRYPMDGFPKAPFPINLLLMVLKLTVGRRTFRSLLTTRKMKAGMPTMPETVFQPDADERAAVQQLLQTVDRFEKFQGPVHPSPLMGRMTVSECLQLQLTHCAHHLAFLEPRGTG